MKAHSGEGPGTNHPRADVSTPVTVAVAGTILILGAGAAYFLTSAGAETLTATSRGLIISGFVGLLVVVSVVAVGRFLPRRDDDHGPGDDQPLQPIPVGPTADLDTELFRILDDPRLADLSTHRQARTPGRRPGAG